MERVSDPLFVVTGMVYPAFGIVFAKGIDGFSQIDPHVRRHDGDRNALWYVHPTVNS